MSSPKSSGRAVPAAATPQPTRLSEGGLLGWLREGWLREGPTWSVGLARIAIGALWLSNALWKVPPDFGFAALPNPPDPSLAYFVQEIIEHPPFGLYQSFMRDLVLPNGILFGYSVLLAELATGISLLLGLFTRLGGLLGTLQALNLMIGLANVPGEWPWAYRMLVLLNLIILATAAGRNWGLDQPLRRWLRPRVERGDRLARWLWWLT
jgi:thiosulfate dehydrogenase (quinone) large subunit